MTYVPLRLAACAGLAVLLAGCAETPRFNEPSLNYASYSSGRIMPLAQAFASEAPGVVYFAFGRADLNAEARRVLDAQAEWILAHPAAKFRVSGHTDLVGGEGDNALLGLARAQAVVGYLGARGVALDRLEAVVSYGESMPVLSVEGPHAPNRRAVTEVSGEAARAAVHRRKDRDGDTWHVARRLREDDVLEYPLGSPPANAESGEEVIVVSGDADQGSGGAQAGGGTVGEPTSGGEAGGETDGSGATGGTGDAGTAGGSTDGATTGGDTTGGGATGGGTTGGDTTGGDTTGDDTTGGKGNGGSKGKGVNSGRHIDSGGGNGGDSGDPGKSQGKNQAGDDDTL